MGEAESEGGWHRAGGRWDEKGAARGFTDHMVSARTGGSTYVFGLPGEPCAPAEVIGFPEFFHGGVGLSTSKGKSETHTRLAHPHALLKPF